MNTEEFTSQLFFNPGHCVWMVGARSFSQR